MPFYGRVTMGRYGALPDFINPGPEANLNPFLPGIAQARELQTQIAPLVVTPQGATLKTLAEGLDATLNTTWTNMVNLVKEVEAKNREIARLSSPTLKPDINLYQYSGGGGQYQAALTEYTNAVTAATTAAATARGYLATARNAFEAALNAYILKVRTEASNVNDALTALQKQATTDVIAQTSATASRAAKMRAETVSQDIATQKLQSAVDLGKTMKPILIGAAVIIPLGLIFMMMRKKKAAVAGYRRRRSRR